MTDGVTHNAVANPAPIPSAPGATPPAVAAPAKTADVAEPADANEVIATPEKFDGDTDEVGTPGWDEL